MTKRPEDEIQEKLVELELSIKDDDAKRNMPAAQGQDTAITVPNLSVANAQNELAGSSPDIDLMTVGGYGLVIGGVAMLLAHMQIQSWFNWFGRTPMMGLLVIPLLLGIGMLFYDYKSRMAQLVTLGTFAVILFVMLTNMTIVFPAMSMLDFVMMAVPLCAGAALLAKAHHKRKQLPEISKSSK